MNVRETAGTMTLAALRKQNGLTQEQLAQRMGVKKLQVSRIEAAYPQVMFTTLRRYMDALGTEIRYVGGVDEARQADLSSSDVVEDPDRRATAAARRSDPGRHGVRQRT